MLTLRGQNWYNDDEYVFLKQSSVVLKVLFFNKVYFYIIGKVDFVNIKTLTLFWLASV